MDERWLPVVGYEDRYEVSDRGNVRAIPRLVTVTSKTGRVFQRRHGGMDVPTYVVKKTGHLYISIYRPEVGNKRHRVHRLVLQAFVGPAPARHEGCHRNGDPTDNRLENLYWGTRSDNMQDMLRHGRKAPLRDQCGKGHLFDEANTRICPNGYRACRACARDLKRRRYHELKAAGVSAVCPICGTAFRHHGTANKGRVKTCGKKCGAQMTWRTRKGVAA